MRKPILLSIAATFVGTSFLWIAGIAAYLGYLSLVPSDPYFFKLSVDGLEQRSGFVVEQLDESYSKVEAEIFRQIVSDGKTQYFGIRSANSNPTGTVR